MRGRALVVMVVAAVAVAPGVAAVEELEAPLLRNDVATVGHEPALVQPGTQWSGFLRVSAESNLSAASYQICRVGHECFAPAQSAHREANTFWFNTSDYRSPVSNLPVKYEAGWRIGVQWYLTENRSGTSIVVPFPTGRDLAAPDCLGEAALSCQESHYFAFDMSPPAKSVHISAAWWMAVAAVGAVALAARRRRT